MTAGSAAPIVTAIPAATTTADPLDAWWRLYDDPALDGFIGEAFAANQDPKTAEANLVASRAISEGARSGLYPQSEMEAAGTYGRDPTTILVNNADIVRDRRLVKMEEDDWDAVIATKLKSQFLTCKAAVAARCPHDLTRLNCRAAHGEAQTAS